MLLGILAGFGTTIIHSVSNIFDAYIVEKFFKKVSTAVFFNGITNIIAIPIILMFGMPQMLTVEAFVFIAIASLIEVFYQFPYYTALKKTDTSVVVAMFSLGKLSIPIMAYFMLGEQLAPMQYFGFFIVIFANLLMNLTISKGGNKKKLLLNAGFILMLIVSLVCSFQAIVSKKGLIESDWVTFMFWYTIITSGLSFTLLFPSSSRSDIKKSTPVFFKNWKTFFGMELANQTAGMLSKYALMVLPVMILKSLTSTQPIFCLISGYILYKLFGDRFKENFDKKSIRRKLIFFAVIIFGVYLTLG